MAEGIERPFPTNPQARKKNGRWRVIWAITRKDMVESLSNSQLLITIIIPIILFLLYRLMFNSINNSGVLDIAVLDLGNSQIVQAMQQNEALELHIVRSEAALHAQINDVGMSGLIIPEAFDEAVRAGENPALTIWLNPPRGQQAETAVWQRFLEAEILALGQQLLPARLEWVTVESDAILATAGGLSSHLLVIVFTLVLFMTGSNIVAMLIVEEKEKKTAVMLTTSPAQISDIVWGKTVAGLVYVTLTLALIIFINGGLTGNWHLVLLYLILGGAVGISAGLILGSLTRSTKQCNSWVSLVMMVFLIPSWFLTLLKVPEPYGSMIRIIPTQFLVAGLNDALNYVSATANQTANLTIWTLFTLLVMAAAAWRIHQKPESIIV